MIETEIAKQLGVDQSTISRYLHCSWRLWFCFTKICSCMSSKELIIYFKSLRRGRSCGHESTWPAVFVVILLLTLSLFMRDFNLSDCKTSDLWAYR